MALRMLVLDGVEWNAWDVFPSTASRLNNIAEIGDLAKGWLTFESEGEKRRLCPIPEGWDGWEEERLALALRAAPIVTRRTAPALVAAG